jgi:hypothetical protein
MASARALGRLIRALGWTILAAILALGGAGLVGQLSHPPGGANRQELTYSADAALKVGLDESATKLSSIADLVDNLAADARTALEQVSAGDGSALQATLDRGKEAASRIDASVLDARDSLARLPGEGPAAAAEFSNPSLVRRAALIAALDAANGLAGQWGSVTAKAGDAARLTILIRDHDSTVAGAASQGVATRYAEAITTLGQAKSDLDQISALRTAFVASTEVTVLDEWIQRHQRYDTALLGLYTALRKSNGQLNPEVNAAYREQSLALAQLPADNRAIIVIVAQVAQGGLDQAVVAIEDARARIDKALAGGAPSQAPA